MYGYIYKTTNLITNKIYIGQKKSKTFLGEEYLGSGVRLNSSILHHGKDKFKVELIEWCSSKEELDKREIFWIKEYDSRNPDIGYNITIGGDGTVGCNIWNKGHTKADDPRLIQSKEEKEKRAKSLSKAHKEGKFHYDEMFTKEVRKKMSDKAKARPHPPTTLGKISYTNGKQNKMLKPDQIEEYENLGWWKGKTIYNKKEPWNKGLTKETDERLLKNSRNRKKLLEVRSIGCFGLKGNHFATGETLEEYNIRIRNN